MSNVNRLDAVWASMTTGDRIVLLGHDRPYLDASDKARLTALLADKANRTATPRRAPRPRKPRRATTTV